jgi:hypothetical protein
MNLQRIGARSALGLTLILVAGLAAAQTTPRNVPPPRPDAPQQTFPEQRVPVAPNQPPGSPGESLSQSQGVIQPPASHDGGGVIAPPNTEKTPMPVIPPPGTPGGNQNVQPK